MFVSQKMSQGTRNQATTRAAPVAQWIERPPPNYSLSDMGIPISLALIVIVDSVH